MARRRLFVIALLLMCCLFGGTVEAKTSSSRGLQELYLQYIKIAYPSAFEYMLIDLNGDDIEECMVGHDALTSGRGYKISILGYRKKKVICMYDDMWAFTIRFNKKKKQLCFETSSGAMSYQYTILKINKRRAKILHSYKQKERYVINHAVRKYYKSNDDMMYNWGEEITEKEFRKVEGNILKWSDITHSPKWMKI